MQCVCSFGGKAPARSEILEGWALPELSKAVKRDEEAEEQQRLDSWFSGMRNRFAK